MDRFDGAAVAAIVRDAAARVAAMRAHGELRLLSNGAEGPTTNVDLMAQEFLIHRLLSLFGSAAIVAEEGPRLEANRFDPSAPLTWIIDPIDGTTAYLRGHANYGVQLAAYGNGALIGGWISCPDLGWNLAAWDGSSVTCDGVDGYETASRLVVADGDFDPGHREAIAQRTAYERSSSCAVDYALLAAGQLDVAVYRRTHPWDHAPGAYLVRRAGGRSVRWNGSAYDPAAPDEGILTAANGVDVAAAAACLLPVPSRNDQSRMPPTRPRDIALQRSEEPS